MIAKRFGGSLFLAACVIFGAHASLARAADGPDAAFAAGSLFQDHMVLQREKPVAVWGTAQPGDAIHVTFANQTKESVTDASGRWQVKLDPLPGSAEARDLTLSRNDGTTIVVKDVLVGEVWLASGQSNMGMGVAGCLNAPAEITAANYPNLRFFSVPGRGAAEPQLTTPGTWQVVSPATVSGMSGTAYFFSREIQRVLDVPVGVIISAVGATAAEHWASAEVLRKDPEWNALMVDQLSEFRRNEEISRTFLPTLNAWREANNCREPERPTVSWAAPELDTTDWKKASGRFALGKAAGLKGGGVIWLRTEFEVPEDKAGNDSGFWVEKLDRQLMTLYVNGKEFASLGTTPPNYYQQGMFFAYVPKGLIKAGKNVLAIRCTTFTADTLKGIAPGPIVSGKGVPDEWLVKAEVAFPEPSAEAIAALPVFTATDRVRVPTALNNAMIHPLIPYTIRGAIWYQGESNVWRANRYKDLLTAIIRDWRSRWEQGDFPVYIVQLANVYDAARTPAPTDTPNAHDANARLREAQLQVAQEVPEAGVAIAIDIGEKDIHPRNKQDVGDRLARLALARTYGRKDVDHQSPIYDSMVREGDAIRVRFKDCPKGLMAAVKNGLEPVREIPDAKLSRFAIAGVDNKFVWADARIDGDSVIVSNPAVPDPRSVRYAWETNPEGCNLYGRNGLPASPFRTDSLPWPTK